MEEESQRSRIARRAAEAALVRVVHHYGETPEFVVLGGLVPELLCAGGLYRHAGTTDVDVQVDIEIACGATNMKRLENALRNAEFVPDGKWAWRWTTGEDPEAVVKFELLADLADERAGAIVHFDACAGPPLVRQDVTAGGRPAWRRRARGRRSALTTRRRVGVPGRCASRT